MSELKRSISSPELGSESEIPFGGVQYDAKLEKQAIRRLDYTILPVMAMFYLLSFLDRANIGNARVAGLQKDLGLTDTQYQIAVTALFVPYIASELPSNLLLRKVGARYLMPSLLTLWGVMVIFQGFVTSYAGLVTVRAFLGLAEGPMLPGIVLYLTGFYTRKDLSLRIALFFSTASVSGAFSGLLAAAIEKMDGIGGKPGWAWIFILEGIFSVLVGLAGFFLVPSTPRESKFLTYEQKELIMMRIAADRAYQTDIFSVRKVISSFTSPHIIFNCIMIFMIGTNLYGLALFLPSIVKQLGFSSGKTQLLSVGPFAAGYPVILIVAYLSDRYKARGIATACVTALAVIGYAIYLSTDHKYISYGSLFFMVPGVYSTAPTVSAWIANNSEPHYRRATSVALCFMATNAGGILSTWSFPTREGPRFRKTTIMNLIFSILVLVGSLLNVLYLVWRNKEKKQAGYREKMLAKYANTKEADGGAEAWMELGDRHPDFVYTL